jgi:membrane fusion protein (multidrug efflux system)
MASKKMYSVVAVVGIGVASTLAWWLQAPKSDAGAATGVRPSGVEITQVKKQTLRDDAEAVGTLRSSQNVMLRPEVAGRVLSLGFADGARVRAGQVLVQMDDTLQRAEVQQSLAQMSIAKLHRPALTRRKCGRFASGGGPTGFVLRSLGSHAFDCAVQRCGRHSQRQRG